MPKVNTFSLSPLFPSLFSSPLFSLLSFFSPPSFSFWGHVGLPFGQTKKYSKQTYKTSARLRASLLDATPCVRKEGESATDSTACESGCQNCRV